MGGLPRFHDPRLLVGFETGDDACVYLARDDLAVLQTVDFFPPVVDDPYLYGQIAAANALSDIYAMGGTPSIALNILCVPSCLPPEDIRQILAGGHSKIVEAGAVLAGGHSVEDDIPKYGMCVTGFARPDAVWSNAGAREGDVLVLTKALGSGVNATAARAGFLPEADFAPTVGAMATLNKYARDAAARYDIHACTDITGFGLLGHVLELAQASGITAELRAAALPVLPCAAAMIEAGMSPGGTGRNRSHLAGHAAVSPAVPDVLEELLFDPQTSGGLVLCLSEADAAALVSRLHAEDRVAAVIGRILPRGEKPVVVV